MGEGALFALLRISEKPDQERPLTPTLSPDDRAVEGEGASNQRLELSREREPPLDGWRCALPKILHSTAGYAPCRRSCRCVSPPTVNA